VLPVEACIRRVNDSQRPMKQEVLGAIPRSLAVYGGECHSAALKAPVADTRRVRTKRIGAVRRFATFSKGTPARACYQARKGYRLPDLTKTGTTTDLPLQGAVSNPKGLFLMSKHPPEDLSPEAYEIGRIYEALPPSRQRAVSHFMDLLKEAHDQGYNHHWVITQLEADARALQDIAGWMRDYDATR
jgi:hypothetical protein